VEVPLSLTALASIPGQQLLTALPGAFVAMQLRPILIEAQARWLLTWYAWRGMAMPAASLQMESQVILKYHMGGLSKSKTHALASLSHPLKFGHNWRFKPESITLRRRRGCQCHLELLRRRLQD
jgi:hypothetical protein